MAKALHLEFELIPAIPLLRGTLRYKDGPICDIIEVRPAGATDYAPFLGALLFETSKPDLSISANFPFELGRASLPKVQIKRVCQAAFDHLQRSEK